MNTVDWTASISKLCYLTFYAQKINAQLSCQTWCWHFVYVPCDSKDITQLDNRRLHIIERADKERGSRSWLAIQGPVFIDLRQVDRILACAGSSQNQDLTENCNIFFYIDQVLIDNPSLIMNTAHFGLLELHETILHTSHIRYVVSFWEFSPHIHTLNWLHLCYNSFVLCDCW